jgi:hypothetical protein
MLKNRVLCNLIAMKKCHVFLTAVEKITFENKLSKICQLAYIADEFLIRRENKNVPFISERVR